MTSVSLARRALVASLSSLALVALVLSQAGCATATVLGWDAIDRVAGPFGYEHTYRSPGPPVEGRLRLSLYPGDPVPPPPPPPEEPPLPEVDPPVVAPPPVVVPPPVVEEPPIVEPPFVEPPVVESDEPVGPPVGVRPLFASCERSGRAVSDRVTLLKRSMHWPVYLFVGFPAGFFSAVFAGVYTYNAVVDAMPDEKARDVAREVLPWTSILLLGFIMADEVGAAFLANDLGEDTVVWEGSDEGTWQPMAPSCDGVALLHDGVVYPLTPDGSLDPWQEAFLVRALVDGGPLLVRWRGGEWPFEVPASVRCRWARERGYPEPGLCQHPLTPTVLTLELESSL